MEGTLSGRKKIETWKNVSPAIVSWYDSLQVILRRSGDAHCANYCSANNCNKTRVLHLKKY